MLNVAAMTGFSAVSGYLFFTRPSWGGRSPPPLVPLSNSRVSDSADLADVPGSSDNGIVHIVLERSGRAAVRATPVAEGIVGNAEELSEEQLPVFVAEREALDAGERPRWVWDDTRGWYPQLLGAGVRIERCVDLILTHAIVRGSVLTAASALASAPAGPWDIVPRSEDASPSTHTALFELDVEPVTAGSEPLSALTEFMAQQEAIAGAADPGRLQLLLAAESAGALIAAEMRYCGLPYSARRHDELLTAALGSRVAYGRPAVLERLAGRIRTELGASDLNPDSPTALLKALRRAGLLVTSTSSWELRELDHPVIEPLLHYKKLSRLLAANGWSWLENWVTDGRLRPDYIPGGVVTGRWATRGSGALQLPRQVRGAVVADPGWKLIVADAAQLEPRILAGLAADTAMAATGRDKDLYSGIAESGAVGERSQAKVAMLGAMYGATTGESGRLMPRLARAFPRAIRFVEDAARVGERGGVVTSRLGRSSPPPSASWHSIQSAASAAESTASDERIARAQARDWGRFTRNFVVQASAAEWALCWMAELRNRLTALSPGRSLTASPHLVYFLHDEVIVHAPAEVADAAAEAVEHSAVRAGRLLFGAFPVDFPVTVAIADSYAEVS